MTREMTALCRALGLCAKARSLTFGVPMVCDALRKGKIKLVLMARDVSDNTRKRVEDKCGYYGVRLISLPIDTQTLAQAVGKTGNLGAVAIQDEQLLHLVERAWDRVSHEESVGETARSSDVIKTTE